MCPDEPRSPAIRNIGVQTQNSNACDELEPLINVLGGAM